VTNEIKEWLNDGAVPRKSRRTVKKHDYLVRNGRFKLSAMGQKIVIYGFSLLPPITDKFPDNERKVKFRYLDYCRTMGIEKSGPHLAEFQGELANLLNVKVYLPDSDKKKWEAYNWFEAVGYDNESGFAYMVYSSELIKRMLVADYFYSPLILKEIGKLKGEYAIRYYEWGRSHETEAGKYGNKHGKWKVTFALSELRLLLGIEAFKYKKTGDFLLNVVDNPAEEINESYFDFTVDPQRIKSGRSVVAVQLNYASRKQPELPLKI
jgi:hypothetical protein